MPLKNQTFRNLLYVISAVFFFIFAKNWEPGLGVSSTTYGVFAKNILSSGNWFHFTLGPGLYDPFVDHPYLALWLDALAFKIFGISAQTIRLVSSVLGICSVAWLYLSVKNISDELHSAWTCLCLFTVTVFLNFMGSGWFDIPMVAFILGGFYFATESFKKNSVVFIFLSGVLLAAAFLTKGIGALGIIPIGVYVLIQNYKKPGALLAFLVGCIAPIALFTWAHYQQEGFLFWSAYLGRQFSQNKSEQQKTFQDLLWYLAALWEMASVLLILFPLGIARLWKKHRGLALLILGQVLLHVIVYSISSRHYRQYTLPVYPWLAIGASYALATSIKKWTTNGITKGLATLGVVFFVVVDILPIRVHSGLENPFRSFSSTTHLLKDNGNVYFPSTVENQDMWEITGSYIAWFFDKTPLRVDPDKFQEELSKNPQALAVVTPDFLKQLNPAADGLGEHKICLWNEELLLLATESICPKNIQNYRAVDSRKQTFTR